MARVEPGVHGESNGVHGWGVRVPLAAAVAVATAGLASDVHMAKGGTFAVPTSVTTPTSVGAPTSVPEAANVDGVVPNEHWSAAPVQTSLAISPPRSTSTMVGQEVPARFG